MVWHCIGPYCYFWGYKGCRKRDSDVFVICGFFLKLQRIMIKILYTLCLPKENVMMLTTRPVLSLWCVVLCSTSSNPDIETWKSLNVTYYLLHLLLLLLLPSRISPFVCVHAELINSDIRVLQTVRTTLWTVDQLVPRPLPTQDNMNRTNADGHPCQEWD
jgi:hypothetical protein